MIYYNNYLLYMDLEAIKRFTENGKKFIELNNHFIRFMDSDINSLEKRKDELLRFNHDMIVKCLIKYELNNIKSPKVGRILTLLNYLDQSSLVNYQIHFKEKYPIKKIGKKPEMEEFTKDKELIKEFNAKIKAHKKEKNLIDDYNFKVNNILEALESLITVDIYGDQQYDITDKDFIYFKFYDYDQPSIDVFVQELRLMPAGIGKKIITIRQEDISGNTPVANSAHEIRVYFNDEDLEEANKNIQVFNAVYDKFVMRGKIMFKIGGESGLNSERKDNIMGTNNNQINNITPITLNTGDENEIEFDWYAKDLEVELSECVFFKQEDGVYAIIPKNFWDENHVVLDNKFMKINDKNVRRCNEIFFKADYDYLSDNCLEEVDIDDVNHKNSDYIFALSNEEYFTITLKSYFKNEGCVEDCEHDLSLNNYDLQEDAESVFTLYDVNGNQITSHKKIYDILISEGFSYSKKLQKYVEPDFKIKKFLKKLNKQKSKNLTPSDFLFAFNTPSDDDIFITLKSLYDKKDELDEGCFDGNFLFPVNNNKYELYCSMENVFNLYEGDNVISDKKIIYDIMIKSGYIFSNKLQGEEYSLEDNLQSKKQIEYEIRDTNIIIVSTSDFSDNVLYGYELISNENGYYYLYNPNKNKVKLESEIDFVLQASGFKKA